MLSCPAFTNRVVVSIWAGGVKFACGMGRNHSAHNAMALWANILLRKLVNDSLSIVKPLDVIVIPLRSRTMRLAAHLNVRQPCQR